MRALRVVLLYAVLAAGCGNPAVESYVDVAPGELAAEDGRGTIGDMPAGWSGDGSSPARRGLKTMIDGGEPPPASVSGRARSPSAP